MRKDYIQSSNGNIESEDDFVESYWTDVWEKNGGIKGNTERIERQDEYKLMRPYLEALEPGARVLDGGCGVGEWVLHLRESGYDAVGMDISRATIAKLGERFPGVEFVPGDIRKTGFADESFDAYFSWGVFEHFEAGPQACIEEAYRLLKPGAYLFISVPLDNVRQSVRGSLARPAVAPQSERFYQYRFTRAELARELINGGFEIESIHPIHKRQGVLRSLHHELGLKYEWFLTRAMSVALAPVLPSWVFAHMALAVARRPASFEEGALK
ncbi:class I SAM-dependent methyltransferase [Nitrogeniibacter aestuarii]|uniref:class I SAM-dependent methyltransferase n=1 Tax=Nitrogeniibacter aestuarii TaxID=2815343 RepID=UPI001E2D43C4|nr:class I SAM-dependent methyltransferase [Nitrogeniibacter aestuarii]